MTIIERSPEVAAALGASALFRELPPDRLQFLVEHSIEIELPHGERLMEMGDPGDCLYFVLRGRLRAIVPLPGGDKTVGEIAPGETVGEMALLTGAPRTVRVVAVRDSTLLKIDQDVFQQLVSRHPRVMLPISRLLVERLSRTLRQAGGRRPHFSLAVIPAGERPAPIGGFCRDLAAALARWGRVRHVTSADQHQALGDDPTDQARKAWFVALETQNDLLIYEVDAALTAWTREAIASADRVLAVGHAAGSPALGEIETAMAHGATGSLAELNLVLQHAPDVAHPTGTAAWLAARTAKRHYHLRISDADDLNRLARVLSGNAVGIAFGGGGARGFAHIGVMRAMQELGIPIDLVGGTSIGAIFGGLAASGMDADAIEQLARATVVRRPPQHDYTFPLMSLVRGRKFALQIKEMFGDRRIEDFWLPYFCVSTSLSRAAINIHRDGPAAQWVLGSCSLPGVLPPIFVDGEIIVDGCILNNVPADLVREDTAGPVIGINLKESLELNISEVHATGINGWHLLMRKLNRFGKQSSLPSLATILTTASALSSTQALERVRQQADVFLEPPVGKYSVLDWKDWHEMGERSYRYAYPILEEWWSKVGATIV